MSFSRKASVWVGGIHLMCHSLLQLQATDVCRPSNTFGLPQYISIRTLLSFPFLTISSSSFLDLYMNQNMGPLEPPFYRMGIRGEGRGGQKIPMGHQSGRTQQQNIFLKGGKSKGRSKVPSWKCPVLCVTTLLILLHRYLILDIFGQMLFIYDT